jgi:4-hydroxybenzoate polyprenyltransferase
MRQRLVVYLQLVKFSHTVFALPFALMGAFLAARGAPTLRVALWMIAAVVGARTCAMTFNRLADRRFDALNPRTATRALATGVVAPWEARTMVVVAGATFVLSCAELNALALELAPLMLAMTLGYSLTKRITWGSHLFLGGALALAPLGGWVAVGGDLHGYPLTLSLSVLFWVAGFDIVYACLDETVDRRLGLYSVPARFGRGPAMRLARCCHVVAFVGFAATGWSCSLGRLYAVGLLVAGGALLFEHLLVTPRTLDRIQLSFFTMNSVVSVVLFAATWLALVAGR